MANVALTSVGPSINTNNSPNAIVQRDANGNIFQSSANMTSLVNTGGRIDGVVTVTSNATLVSSAAVHVVCTPAGSMALTLPPVALSQGVEFQIVNTTSHWVTLTGNSSDNILIPSTISNTYPMSTLGQMVVIWADGTNWYAKI